MLISLVRTFILYALLVIALRTMGKRVVGQLQPFELATIILISNLAAVPMEDVDIPILSGIIPILILVVSQFTLSYMAFRSNKARAIICGTPSIVVRNGKIVEKELEKLRYNINDLLEQLRVKDFSNIADVEFAILEPNGQLSVIPKSQKRPICPEDLQIQTKYEGLPIPLILDGEASSTNLSVANLDTQWLMGELAKFNITSLDDVLFASLDTSGNLFIQTKDQASTNGLGGEAR
jgi:uncharacterized membrane protein YcaP (DUF421 family)